MAVVTAASNELMNAEYTYNSKDVPACPPQVWFAFPAHAKEHEFLGAGAAPPRLMSRLILLPQ